jgi:hypothetical protein
MKSILSLTFFWPIIRPGMFAVRTGQGYFFTGLGGHALQFQVKVKAFAALGALEMIHFFLSISSVEITTLEIVHLVPY